MSNHLLRRTFAVLAGTALVSVGAATVAAAAPAAPEPAAAQRSASVSATTALAAGPTNCVGIATAWAATCYQWDGDDQWVIDGDANGWTAIAHVETNYGKTRECVAPAAADGWKECKYDHREGTCVRFFLYEKKGSDLGRFSAWSPWYKTSNGNAC
ncbi:hypothetical protein [Streptomyces sp. SID13031]|uniref:hypothetical protein n=1 Tax=Streptomyces sp. SID13031 TaxID=2706046 RepID=UPI0013C8B412|nr:hypothetical protein [Streptomyces sp. SID13031]NEA34524.1 hypothetical protein [Streptomyces sp. SID13031]